MLRGTGVEIITRMGLVRPMENKKRLDELTEQEMMEEGKRLREQGVDISTSTQRPAIGLDGSFDVAVRAATGAIGSVIQKIANQG